MPQLASSTTTTARGSSRPYQHWPYVAEHSDSHRFVEALPTERVEFNQAAVFRRLRVSELDGRLVASCKETLLRVCARSIWMLKVLVAATRPLTLEDVEVGVASSADSALCRDTAQERVMCTLLVGSNVHVYCIVIQLLMSRGNTARPIRSHSRSLTGGIVAQRR